MDRLIIENCEHAVVIGGYWVRLLVSVRVVRDIIGFRVQRPVTQVRFVIDLLIGLSVGNDGNVGGLGC